MTGTLTGSEPGTAEPSVLHLDPATGDQTSRLLARRDRLHGWVAAFGSPLNIVLPDEVADNADRFQEVLRARRLRGQVYFAHKANRSSAVVRRLAATSARLDVASVAELQHGLGAGFAPERIMVTGPKSPELLWLAARLGVTVHVDSVDELAQLGRIATRHGAVPAETRLPVLVRFGAFASTGSVRARVSRFGVAESELDQVLAVADRYRCRLDLCGVGYHLDTVGLPEKVSALDGCLRLQRQLQQAGHPAAIIDVGGGFGVSYLAEAKQWEEFTTELTRAVLGQRPPLTWRGHGYGLRADGGRIRGALSLYPAYRPVAGPGYLEELLGQRSPSLEQTFEQLLRETMTELYLEPGRALLDQAGLVLCRVLETRLAADGSTMIRLDLNHGDITLEQHGIVMDPVVVPKDSGSRSPGKGYLVGNLCLEADLISRREVHLRSMPVPGDLLAFVNTAGYLMDFFADQALQQRVARKVAVASSGARWCLDEEYWPLAVDNEPGSRHEEIR
ncbi:MAG: alanine racemase [Actinomycetia bacterium]|nr:alanine racemase [Actinomycetes bacterium]